MSAPTNRSGVGSSGGADRAVVTTDAPELRRRRTMASPMPLVPPVTSARLPPNSLSGGPLILVPRRFLAPFHPRHPRILAPMASTYRGLARRPFKTSAGQFRRELPYRRSRPHRSILSGLGLAELAECGERIRDLAQRDQHRLLVLQPCLLPLRDGGAICAKRAAGIEQRPAEHARDGPDRRAAARERRDLRARGAEERGQAELGKELG